MKQIIKQKYFILLCIVVLMHAFTACDSDDNISNELNAKIKTSELTIGEAEAQKSFAKILSVAAVKDKALRLFLKSEAEKQYDKDYDVFYPFVKDKIVKGNKTFREILASYASEKEITTIENSVPLLTIMIPNLSAFEAFSIEKWDVSDDQIAVTYVKDNDKSVFYAEGDSLLS